MEPHRQAQQQAAWQSLAQSRGWRAWALWPLSLLYGALVALHQRLYRWGLLSARRLPVPVVVVGNVVVGGAGKTPTVLALVQHLRQRGWRPGVISRGYGRKDDAPTHVHPDTPAAQVGDEPLQIRRQTGVPVCVARSRVDAGHALLAAHPEVNLIVCDDGLQHLALHADLRIAVFDDRGLGNGWLLPAGLLREPWPPSSARPLPQVLLRQSRAGQAAANIPVPEGARCFDAQRSLGANAVNPNGTTRSLDSFLDAPVSALAGVARPDIFFDMLSDRGLRLQASAALPDHAEAAAVIASSQQLPAPVLCTEKDMVKLVGAAGQPSVWAVPLQVTIDPAFFDAVDSHLPLPPVPRG